jgi:hypothetical protein
MKKLVALSILSILLLASCKQRGTPAPCCVHLHNGDHFICEGHRYFIMGVFASSIFIGTYDKGSDVHQERTWIQVNRVDTIECEGVQEEAIKLGR